MNSPRNLTRCCQIYSNGNSYVFTRIIQLEHNAVTCSQYNRRETIELNHVPAHMYEDFFEESICRVLSLTGVNYVSEDLHACHCRKRSGRLAHLVSWFACNTRVIVNASSSPPISHIKVALT